MKARLREQVFDIVVEKDEDGYYVASVVELPGCHTQAKSLDQLKQRLRKAVEGYLRAGPSGPSLEFIEMRQLRISLAAP